VTMPSLEMIFTLCAYVERDLSFTMACRICLVKVIGQNKNTAANGNARSTLVAGLLPGRAKSANLGRLLNVERFTGLVEFQG
jgi:hypothetical protein